MFIEIAFIQKFVLFLSHPLYAVAVVLFAFLLFAGTGSAASRRWRDGSASRCGTPEAAVVGAIALSATLCLGLFPGCSSMRWRCRTREDRDLGRAHRTAGVLHGHALPHGAGRVEAADARLVPWAWAVNGCASVIGAVLATLLAIHIGFTAVVVAALVLYAVAAACHPDSR